MLLQASYTIKTRTWLIWIILSLSGIPGLILLVLQPASKSGLLLLGMTLLFGLVLFAVSKAYKIYIDDDQLIFHAYGRKKAMKWKEIKSSAIPWTIEGHSAGPSLQLHSFDGNVIEIPLGYYSRSDMQLLAAQLIAKAKAADLSPRIHQFAVGKFPWYIF